MELNNLEQDSEEVEQDQIKDIFVMVRNYSIGMES